VFSREHVSRPVERFHTDVEAGRATRDGYLSANEKNWKMVPTASPSMLGEGLTTTVRR
jgi:hypothetical protein